MSRRPATPEPDIPEDEEIDFDEEMMGEEQDLMDMLGSFLSTEDGDTVATSLASIKDALLVQNKIFVKILAALSAEKKCCSCCSCKKEETA
jgi:hypothetical protein